MCLSALLPCLYSIRSRLFYLTREKLFFLNGHYYIVT